MADYEDDGIEPTLALPPTWRSTFWMEFDRQKERRIKLKWGFLRPSFKVAALEPLFVKLIGPRATSPSGV